MENASNSNSREEFKVVLVGDSGVGKTSLVVRYTEYKFLNVHDSTLGVDCKKSLLEVRGVPIELRIWDTAGQERFKSIVNRFYRSADGALIVYDVTKKSSFDNVPWWLEDIRNHCPCIPIFLVGNKAEDTKNVEVLDELVQDFAEEHHIVQYKTSAKDNVNVDQLFSFAHLTWGKTVEVFRNLASVMLADRESGMSDNDRTYLWPEGINGKTRIGNIKLERETKKRSCCSYFDKKPSGFVI